MNAESVVAVLDPALTMVTTLPSLPGVSIVESLDPIGVVQVGEGHDPGSMGAGVAAAAATRSLADAERLGGNAVVGLHATGISVGVGVPGAAVVAFLFVGTARSRPVTWSNREHWASGHEVGCGMTPNDVTDPAAVRAAAAEYDRAGEVEFLASHHFGPARRYVVVIGGREYDSKAILGVAHGYQYPDLGDLDRRSFSGGRATTVPLERMGFEIRDRQRAASS